MGFCPNGNLKHKTYHWSVSDQPGLWYALIMAHQEWSLQHQPQQQLRHDSVEFQVQCNKEGYIDFQDPKAPMGSEFNQYFTQYAMTSTHTDGWHVISN